MRKWGVCRVRQPADGSTWAWALVASASIASTPERRAAGAVRARSLAFTLDAMRTGAQASTGPFDPPICPIDWQTVTLAPCGASPAVTVSAYCGRGNDAGAKRLTDEPVTLAARRAASLDAAVRSCPALVPSLCQP